MDLRDELARQSLLLQFIAECAGIDSVPSLLGVLASHLRWIADHDNFTVRLPDDEEVRCWEMKRGGELVEVDEETLPPTHRRAIDQTMRDGSPALAAVDEVSGAAFALPLGTSDRTIGALLLVRRSEAFSQSDVRHLQHAVRAVGAALARIVGLQAERRAQRAVEAAESRLRALAEDRALFAEQMVGIVSHDLRNPLAAIVMGAGALGRPPELPPQKARVLEGVTSAVNRARRMIDVLLDFTVLRVGEGLQVTRVPVDLHELAARSVEELSLTFDGRTVLHRMSGRGPVDADGDRIEQAIGNLVANAMKYGAAESPVVVTSAIAEGVATLSVHNHGAPISEDVRSTLFEPMVHGSTSDSRTRSVGLGLFIVRAIAQAHGGSVEARSNEVDGTLFTMRFPADDGASMRQIRNVAE